MVEWQVWHLREDLTGEVTWEQRFECLKRLPAQLRAGRPRQGERQVQRPCGARESGRWKEVVSWSEKEGSRRRGRTQGSQGPVGWGGCRVSSRRVQCRGDPT